MEKPLTLRRHMVKFPEMNCHDLHNLLSLVQEIIYTYT